MAGVRRSSRRSEATWVLLLLAFFAFLLVTAWERVANRETARRIEHLERELACLNAEEAFLQVQLQQACRFTEVRDVAQKRWGMSVADPGQCIYLAASGASPQPGTTGSAQAPRGMSLMERITHLFGEGMAREAHARSSDGGEGEHAARPR